MIHPPSMASRGRDSDAPRPGKRTAAASERDRGTRSGGPQAGRFPSPHRTFNIAGAVAAALVMGLGIGLVRLPWPWAYLLGVNAAAILLFGYDKFAAGKRFLRVPERTLHLFVLCGGTAGAYVAQWWFRHKVAKSSFRGVFWALAALQAIVATLLWYYIYVR